MRCSCLCLFVLVLVSSRIELGKSSEENEFRVSTQIGLGKSSEENEVRATTAYSEYLLDNEDGEIDPLECCNIEEFIQPTWRAECGFNLKWDNIERLTIVNKSDVITTTSSPPLTQQDVKIVPIACDQQKCIFSKLNITIGDAVDKDAFSKLLDNMLPEWRSAKAKVVTQCLTKHLIGYEGDCEINKILACTFDILTENCPNAKKDDSCKHLTYREGLICQISSSRYRPKHRRQFCSVPNFVDTKVSSECGVHLIYKLEYVQPAVKTSRWAEVINCKELTDSTRCLLSKMNVLNKYGFIDHFRMKDHITAQQFPDMYRNIYINTFNNGGLYQTHCSSSRKLLNVLDSILSTCPADRLSTSNKCQKLMKKINSKLENLIYLDLFSRRRSPRVKSNKPVVSIYKTNPVYNFGILGKGDSPSVELLDLKSEKPLVLLPVYARMKDRLAINSVHNDGVFRS